MKKNLRRGSALIIVMVLTGVMSLAVGGIMSYVSYSTRASMAAIGRDMCRLAAQSEIEIAKSAIDYQYQLSLNRYARLSIGSGTFSSFDWFEAYSGATPKRNIGKAMGTRDTSFSLDETSERNGCTVKVRIGRVEHTVGTQWADVTLVAEATRNNPGGTVSKAVIAEKIRFATQRSRVFDHAYFVNNYGYFHVDKSKVNGDVRSNGNFSVKKTVVINGHIYAARNEELGVAGNIVSQNGSGLGEVGTMATRSEYIRDANNGTYGSGQGVRPLRSDPVTSKINIDGYDAPINKPTYAEIAARCHPNEEMSVEMPFIGDITSENSEYRTWAQAMHEADPDKATIKQKDENGVLQTLVEVYHDAPGPSGVATITKDGQQIQAPDYGAILLEGTASRPIVINGPVFIPSDVIIKGVVKGQGTIYSGRNIHIIDDITYANPPVWEGGSNNNANNSQKDMLGLMAKGNIVFGNYTGNNGGYNLESTGVKSALTNLHHYHCDITDVANGYPLTFGGSYIAVESVPKTVFNQASSEGVTSFVPGGLQSNGSNYNFGRTVEREVTRSEVQQVYNQKKRKWENKTVQVFDHYEYDVQYDRKYYQTVCSERLISEKGKKLLQRIDAVLYNNHGLFGCVGGCTFNGSVVCRDEGIVDSSRDGNHYNWDYRLSSKSNEAVGNDDVGLAMSSDAKPVTLWWMEIPDGVITF